MLLFAIALIAAQADQPAAVAPPPASQPVPSDDGFIVGVDTIATVTAKLGRPLMRTSSSNGQTVIAYSTSKTRVKGTSFIPIVGLFAGGAKSHLTIKTFVFGSDGKLMSYLTNASDADCSLGFGSVGCH